MSRLIRRLILAPIAAASLLVSAAGVALADPASTVSVYNADGTPAGATVCEFYFEFNPAPGGESGAWELRDADSTAVESGMYEVTAATGDRQPDAGSFSLPDGTYTVLWDDEPVIDRSNEELDIVVECEDETPAPPTPTFIQSVAADTDAPSQDVADDTDAPERTLPDTTSFDQPARPDAGAWTGLLLLIAGLAAFVLALTPKRGTHRR